MCCIALYVFTWSSFIVMYFYMLFTLLIIHCTMPSYLFTLLIFHCTESSHLLTTLLIIHGTVVLHLLTLLIYSSFTVLCLHIYSLCPSFTVLLYLRSSFQSWEVCFLSPSNHPFHRVNTALAKINYIVWSCDIFYSFVHKINFTIWPLHQLRICLRYMFIYGATS